MDTFFFSLLALFIIIRFPFNVFHLSIPPILDASIYRYHILTFTLSLHTYSFACFFYRPLSIQFIVLFVQNRIYPYSHNIAIKLNGMFNVSTNVPFIDGSLFLFTISSFLLSFFIVHLKMPEIHVYKHVWIFIFRVYKTGTGNNRKE